METFPPIERDVWKSYCKQNMHYNKFDMIDYHVLYNNFAVALNRK